MDKRRAAWLLARGILLVSGISLAGYIVYRYTVAGNPPQVGTLYGTIFPASILLAILAVTLAVKPYLFRDADGMTGYGVRGGLLLFGAGWMGTGLLCVQSLTAGMIDAPVLGTLDFMHMLSHHVVIPAGMGFLVGIPTHVMDWVGSPSPDAAASPGELGKP